MLVIDTSAASAVKEIVDAHHLPEGGGVRIVADEPTGNSGALRLTVSAAGEPFEDDEVLSHDGASVFVEPVAAEFLDDKVLTAIRDERGTSFQVHEQ
jgi:Fe-S cluster assembly iron-binding protein IscA